MIKCVAASRGKRKQETIVSRLSDGESAFHHHHVIAMLGAHTHYAEDGVQSVPVTFHVGFPHTARAKTQQTSSGYLRQKQKHNLRAHMTWDMRRSSLPPSRVVDDENGVGRDRCRVRNGQCLGLDMRLQHLPSDWHLLYLPDSFAIMALHHNDLLLHT